MNQKCGRIVEGRIGKTVIALAFALAMCMPALAQTFSSGNLVVSVEGCGVHGGTCTSVSHGTGTGTDNSSAGGYGDNQAGPLTLFQYAPSGTTSATFVNSLLLPQTSFGANFPVSGEYGSSSEGTLQLSGNGYYLTLMGYGINAATFDGAYYQCAPSQTCPASGDPYGAAPSGALAQSGSLTGQSYTAVPRILALIDAFGDVNSTTALYNIFNTNNPRSAYTADGTTAYVSGQGTGSDLTGGVFYLPALFITNTAPTAITGADSGAGVSQDTRTVQIYNDTLYISTDSKAGSYNRSYIGTLGSPPATSVFTCTGVGAGCPTGDGTIGPALMTGFGNTGGTGKETITTNSNSNGNSLNTGLQVNISPSNYFFASPSVLYVADTGSPKNTSNTDTICTNDGGTGSVGDGGLQKWVNSMSNGSGTWSLAYTLYAGLNLQLNIKCDPSSTTGTTGLYGLTGTVSGSTVYLYATNYTIADLDPTYLYGITDTLGYTTASQASSEAFTVLDTAPADSNFKGVSFVPQPITPANVTSQISTTASGLLYSRATKQFTGTVTIQNTSGSSVSGPFLIGVTALPGGVTLINATGSYSGSPYISVPLSTLAPGQSATVGLQFSDPSLTGITFTPVIYSEAL